MGPRSSRHGTSSRLLGPPVLGSPDVGRVWGVLRTPAPCPAPSWSAETAALDRPEPLLQQLLTRTARGQDPCHLRDSRHGQEKQQQNSRGGPDSRHVRAGRSGAVGCSDPAWPPPLLAEAPPRRPGPLVVGCGALKPRPSTARRFQNLLGAGTCPRPWLFVKAQLFVRFCSRDPSACILQEGSQRIPELKGP